MHQDINTVLRCLGHIYLIYCCSDPTDPVIFLCVKKRKVDVSTCCVHARALSEYRIVMTTLKLIVLLFFPNRPTLICFAQCPSNNISNRYGLTHPQS